MADAGVIQQFLVGLGFKIDEGTQQRFTKALDQARVGTTQLQQQLQTTGKSVGDLGKSFALAGGQPARQYQEQQEKLKKGNEGFAKSFTELGRVAILTGGTFVKAIQDTARQYEQLYYQSQRTGDSIEGLQNLAQGFKQVGLDGGEAAQAMATFSDKIRLDPGTENLVRRLITPEDAAYVTKTFGDTLTPVEKQFQEFLHAMGRQRNAWTRAAYEQDVGMSDDLATRLRQNQDMVGAGTRAAADANRRAGLDQNKIAAQSVALQRQWNDLTMQLDKVWQQAFSTITPALTLVLGLLDDAVKAVQVFNKLTFGWGAVAETLIGMSVGWVLLLKAISPVLRMLNLVAPAAEGAAESIGFIGKVFAPFKWAVEVLGSIARTLGLIAPEAAKVSEAAGAMAKAFAPLAGIAESLSGLLGGIARFLGPIGAVISALQIAHKAAQASPEELDPNSAVSKQKSAALNKRVESGWLGGILALPERAHEAIFGKTAADGAAGAPGAAGAAGIDRYQGGGVVPETGPALLHAREMVLPEKIASPLQRVIGALSGAGGKVQQPGDLQQNTAGMVTTVVKSLVRLSPQIRLAEMAIAGATQAYRTPKELMDPKSPQTARAQQDLWHKITGMQHEPVIPSIGVKAYEHLAQWLGGNTEAPKVTIDNTDDLTEGPIAAAGRRVGSAVGGAIGGVFGGPAGAEAGARIGGGAGAAVGKGVQAVETGAKVAAGAVRATAAALPAEAKGLLDTIAGTESGGKDPYTTVYGGGHKVLAPGERSPAIPIRSGPNAGMTSSAYGRYQFINPTWEAEAKKLGLKGRSPEEQDRAAWDLAETTYREKTHRDLTADIKAGKTAEIGAALHSQWTSLPGGIEQAHGNVGAAFAQRLASNVAAQRKSTPSGPAGTALAALQQPLPGTTSTAASNVPTWQKLRQQTDQMQTAALTSGANGMGGPSHQINNNEGDRNVTINQNNTTHIEGGTGDTARLAAATRRNHADMLRHSRAALA